MSNNDCDDPTCHCCNGWSEVDPENVIHLDFKEVLKYKEKYGSWLLANSRTVLDYYKENGTEEEIKRQKMIWRNDKRVDRRMRREAFFRGFKRGLLLPFTEGKHEES